MKRSLLIFSLILAFCSGDAFAQSKKLKNICKNISNVSNNSVFIYKNSAPVRNPSTLQIIGFRREPTLIMNRNVSFKGTTTIYDTNGNSIGRCPWATAHGHAGGRYRCTMQTGSLRATAVRNTGKPTVYFYINRDTCAAVPDAGRCYGSVKGLCNQVITR